MSTAQRAAARKNIKKAVAAAKRKRTVAHLPKATRTALGKEGAKASVAKGITKSDRIGPGKELLARIVHPQEEPRRPVLTVGISSTRTSTCTSTSTRNNAFRNSL
jgi:hypothetical protein